MASFLVFSDYVHMVAGESAKLSYVNQSAALTFVSGFLESKKGLFIHSLITSNWPMQLHVFVLFSKLKILAELAMVGAVQSKHHQD